MFYLPEHHQRFYRPEHRRGAASWLDWAPARRRRHSVKLDWAPARRRSVARVAMEMEMRKVTMRKVRTKKTAHYSKKERN